MRTQRQEVGRGLDGSIAIDVSRQKCLIGRRAAMTGSFKGFGKLAKPLVAVALIAAAVYASPSRDGTGWVAPTASVAGSNKVSLAYPMTAAQLYALNATR